MEKIALVTVSCILMFCSHAQAASLAPHLLKDKNLSLLQAAQASDADFRNRGGDAPEQLKSVISQPFQKSIATTTRMLKILTILVDFSDNAHQVNADTFDTLIYGAGSFEQPTVQHYYDQASFGRIKIAPPADLPSNIGWVRAPKKYSYYTADSAGRGNYPANSQGLLEDVVNQIDAQIDFSQYDGDGDGIVDGIAIIHSGPGAEFTGDMNQIWSHKWNAYQNLIRDGVVISPYTIQGEYHSEPGDFTIGIFAHELGHVLGLPDLYDTDNTSLGVGNWSLMGRGSWNGTNGSSPSYLDAWSKIQLGIISPTLINSETLEFEFSPTVQGGATVRIDTSAPGEYFLFENRQLIDYDAFLPGSGLLIWHIDDNEPNNTNEWLPGSQNGGHYKVALEQGDSLFDLEHKYDNGDAGDPYPGAARNDRFIQTSTPSSLGYSEASTSLSVRNISEDQKMIHADFFSPPPEGVQSPRDQEVLSNTFVLQVSTPNPYRKFRVEFNGQFLFDIEAESFDEYVGAWVSEKTVDSLKFPNGWATLTVKELANFGKRWDVEVDIQNSNPGYPVPFAVDPVVTTKLKHTQKASSYVDRIEWAEDLSARGYVIFSPAGERLVEIYDNQVTSWDYSHPNPLDDQCYRVLSYNQGGWSSDGTTACAHWIKEPQPPTDLVVLSAKTSYSGVSSVTLQWDADPSSLETIEIYGWVQGRNIEEKLSNVRAFYPWGRVDSLSPNRTYCFKVRGKNALGVSGGSNIQCAETPPSPPCDPRKQNCAAIDANSSHMLAY